MPSAQYICIFSCSGLLTHAKWVNGILVQPSKQLRQRTPEAPQQEALVRGVIIPGGKEMIFMQALNLCRFREPTSLFKHFEMSILKAMTGEIYLS